MVEFSGGGSVALYDRLFRNPDLIGFRERWLGNLETRSPDGTGNNRGHADWGATRTTYQRVTENSYPDRFGASWDVPVQERLDRNGAALVGDDPQPREITSRIMAQPTTRGGADIDLPSKVGVNEYFQYFGQFLAHDLAQAAGDGTEAPLFLDGLPFPFRRTAFEIGSDAENGRVRQQVNSKTSFLDLSQVYGITQAAENLLRARDADAPNDRSARLLTGDDGMLPTFREVADDKRVAVSSVIAALNPGAGAGLYATGDNRANQTSPLLTHHVTWSRNHNWHVERLREQFPSWNEERLFEAARALNEADWQNVVYSEYVAKLVGPRALSAYSGYDARVDPSIINEWTTVAFRFGHDQTSNDLGLLAENGRVVDRMTLAEAFGFKADGLRDDKGLGDWMRGQLARYSQEIDGKIVQGNRNLLFGNGVTTDLTVLDIQRGRDHGVGHFNKLRDGLGLDRYDSFNDFGRQNGIDARTLAALKDVYGNRISQLDSLVGGLLEKRAPGSILGETFTLLNVMQFEALRDGDRFFYLNRLTPALADRIEATSLAEILARSTPVDHIYRDAFLAHDRVGGTGASERLWGSSGRDLMIGFGGWDRLSGGPGNDDLHGDRGGDRLFGGPGNDVLSGGRDDDALHGGIGQDFLDGGTGDDLLYGGGWADVLLGGAGRDRLHGGTENDRLDGGPGDDRLWGDAGRDVFVFRAGTGRDVVHGFSTVDRLDVSAFGFDTIRELREATTVSRGSTFIELDRDDTIVLAGVDWNLHSRHVIFDDISA